MAKPTGKRFSDREETQKGSKDSKAVTKEGLTNKSDKMPSGKADFMKDAKSDINRMLKDDKPTTGAARASQEAARDRAASRTGGRAGAIGTALSAGYGVGRAIGEAGGDEVNLKEGDKITHTQDAVVLEKMISQFLYNKASENKSDNKAAE